jgi:hypothetical protein
MSNKGANGVSISSPFETSPRFLQIVNHSQGNDDITGHGAGQFHFPVRLAHSRL